MTALLAPRTDGRTGGCGGASFPVPDGAIIGEAGHPRPGCDANTKGMATLYRLPSMTRVYERLPIPMNRPAVCMARSETRVRSHRSSLHTRPRTSSMNTYERVYDTAVHRCVHRLVIDTTPPHRRSFQNRPLTARPSPFRVPAYDASEFAWRWPREIPPEKRDRTTMRRTLRRSGWPRTRTGRTGAPRSA